MGFINQQRDSIIFSVCHVSETGLHFSHLGIRVIRNWFYITRVNLFISLAIYIFDLYVVYHR